MHDITSLPGDPEKRSEGPNDRITKASAVEAAAAATADKE
jgi:hypothetical protein